MDKIEETENRLGRSKGETQEVISQLKRKLIETEDKLGTLKQMKESLVNHRVQTLEKEGRLDVKERQVNFEKGEFDQFKLESEKEIRSGYQDLN